MKIIIIGAGIAGLATSIALSKHISPAPDITLIELRPVLSSIGGAIGLTPNALRALNHLGVLQGLRERGLGCDVKRIELFGIYSGARLGEIDFDGQGGGIGSNEAGKFRGLRIMRKDLVAALLDRARQCDNVRIEFGRKMKGIDETNESIRVSFEDGNHISGHMLIGCDGVHSSVRKLVVHPDRVPEYTGIAAVFGFADVAGVQDTGATIPWDTTGLCQSRRGSLLCSFCEPMKNEVFLGAIMETKDVQSKEGWKAKAAEQEQIKKSVWERYSGSKMDCLDALIEQSRDWSLYPVYTLGPGGTWSSKRTILLGDAAHAVSPKTSARYESKWN
jgi:2-polyprenyl-6-methoxyphenol hydroxylase-like FAD-dependent oxidoreductase